MASFSNFKSTIVSASNEAAGTTAGVTVYANTDALPYVGNSDGDQAYVSSNNRLYIWQGSGWYSVALINTAPAISAVQDSDGNTTPFALALDGTVTTITITAADSDGDPITYSAVADSDFAGLATVSDSDNVFTITPFSLDSATTESGTITFKATDGVNIASSGVQTFTLNFVSALWDETVLSIGTSSTNSLDNSTFIDRSTNAHTVTTSGTPTQTAFHPYLENWSVEFDGNGDYITYPDNTDYEFGTSAFTIELFVYFSTSTTTDYTFVANYVDPNQGWGFQWRPNQYSSAPLRFFLGGSAVASTNSFTPEIGKWYHLAVTRSSGTTKIFVDGTEVASGSDTNNYNSGGSLTFGRIGNVNAQYFNGYISNVRIVKGTALYTTNFTRPTEKLTAVTNTVFLSNQSNRFIDNSTNGATPTVNGNCKISASNPFGQESEYAAGENKGSILLNGINNYLSLPSSSLYNFTGDFTIEAWVYINGNSPLDNASTRTAIIVSTQQTTDGIVFQIGGNSSTTGINLNVEIRSGTNIGYSATASIPQQSWNHCVVVRSSGTLTFYLNGVNIGTSAVSTNIPAGALTVGYMGNTGYPRYLNGLISDIRIVNGTAVYTSNFTPPTAPVSNTNASLYLPFDNAGIFDKTGNNTLTLYGNTSTSTTQTKFANTAMYFDGSGDYITTDFPALGTGDFTIEFWINPSTIDSNYKALFDTRTSNANNPLVWIRNTNVIYYYSGAADRIIGTTTLSTSTWYHVTVCRSSGTTKLFLNGTQEGSDYSNTASYTADTLFIGQRFNASPTYYYHGYIENFQILNGVAKYTANFTPPTREQGIRYQAED